MEAHGDDAGSTEKFAAEMVAGDTGRVDLEKRRAPRFATNAGGRLRLGRTEGTEGWQSAIPVVACDVSAGGLLLASSYRTSKPLRPGSIITVKVVLEGDVVVVHGKLTWIHDSSDAWIAGLLIDSRELSSEARLAWEHWHLGAAGFF